MEISDEDVDRIAKRVIELKELHEFNEEDAFSECYDEALDEYLKSLGRKNTFWNRLRIFFSTSDEYRIKAAIKYYHKYGIHVIDTDINMNEVKRRIENGE